MNKELKVKISFVVLWIFLVSSFLVLAVFILYEANGYRLNQNNWQLESTGMIMLDGQPKQVDSIMINGKNFANVFPLKTKKILPGYYEIIINKTDYSNWSKTIKVDGGQAYEDKKIFLFFSKPVIKESERKFTSESLKNDAKNQGLALSIIDNEIWYQEELITRFSSKPKSAILTDDKYHILFQLENELRVIELDGSNNTKLLDFPLTDSYDFIQNNDMVYYSDKDKIFESEIR